MSKPQKGSQLQLHSISTPGQSPQMQTRKLSLCTFGRDRSGPCEQVASEAGAKGHRSHPRPRVARLYDA